MYFLLKTFITKRCYAPIYLINDMINHYGDDGMIYHSVLIFNMLQITSSKMAKLILNHKHALARPVFGQSKNSNLHIDIESTADGTKPFANINGKEWEKRRKL